MSKLLDAIDSLATRDFNQDWGHPAIREFLITGDDTLLNNLPVSLPFLPWELAHALPDPDEWTAEAGNFLRLAVAASLKGILRASLERYARDEEWGKFPAAVEKLRESGIEESALRQFLLGCPLLDEKNRATPAGTIVLEEPDEELIQVMNVDCTGHIQIPLLMARSQPARLQAMLDDGLKFNSPTTVFGRIANVNPACFGAAAFKFCQSLSCRQEKIGLAIELVKADAETYFEFACGETRAYLGDVPEGGEKAARDCSRFLLNHGLPDALDLICAWMADFKEQNDYYAPGCRESILESAKDKHPEMVLPMAQACARSLASNVALLGLKWWREAGLGHSTAAFQDALHRVLSQSDASDLVEGISEARSFGVHLMQDDLWPLMDHKSRPVRSAAARALAGLGYAQAEEKALKLLAHKKVGVRQAAVLLLSQTASPDAARNLKLRLDEEENDTVRDDLFLALERAGAAAELSPGEMQARITKTLAKAKETLPAWISVSSLKFQRQDGTPLSPDEVRYLLIRQSRANAMRPDLEVKSLYAALDRTACGKSAEALLQAFLTTEQNKTDRWVLAVAALTGDDRLVPVLRKAILDWVERYRGKLAECGVQALALLGTEAALMVVDNLSVRFRSKNKELAQVASDAFAAAAAARGVTAEELGELVVPWLGFEPGKPRTVATAKAVLEARIDAAFKLSFRDMKTGKVMPKLPAGASAEVQTEFKTLAGILKEAVKAQLPRMETLLVRQFRWPVARWQELYRMHPLLRPFTQRLIWAWRDASGSLAGTFRALEDGTLSDVEDNPVSLAREGTVSLVHPMELSDEVRAAWIQHLADYDVAPPFAQLDRPTIRCSAEDASLKFGRKVDGVQLFSMTFHGRAGKLGWSPGPFGSHGSISTYKKIYSGAGVEACLDMDGMYDSAERSDTVILGRIYFVKAGSVQGSDYDKPWNDADPRLISFGDVPLVPFSETMGDLVRICGTAAGAETISG